MKKRWKEISKSIRPRKFLAVTGLLIITTLIGCKPKSADNGNVDATPVTDERIDLSDYSPNTDTSSYRPSGFLKGNTIKTTNAEDEYNDRLDEYLDDPEDELRFDPEIFDFQDD